MRRAGAGGIYSSAFLFDTKRTLSVIPDVINRESMGFYDGQGAAGEPSGRVGPHLMRPPEGDKRRILNIAKKWSGIIREAEVRTRFLEKQADRG